MSNLRDRKMNIIITGAARGIGRHLTRSLVSAGHRVFLIDNNGAELEHTVSLLRKATDKGRSGQDAPPFEAANIDLASLSAIKTAVSQASAFFDNKLDLLINNAMAMPHTLPEPQGSGEQVSIDPSSGDDEHEAAVEAHWDLQIAVGLSAPFHLSRLCVPLLRGGSGEENTGTSSSSISSGADGQRWVKPRGSIVNVSSTRARQAEVDHEGYSAAKAGLLGLSQAMSVSLGLRYGIRVNSLVLGWVGVEAESVAGDEASVPWGQQFSAEDHAWHPAGRVGKGDDVLRAVEYLAGAEWVTGEELVLDGGVGRRMVYPE